MGRPRTFLGAGCVFIVFGLWAVGFWYVSNWNLLLRAGGVLLGIGLLFILAALFFRRQGWE